MVDTLVPPAVVAPAGTQPSPWAAELQTFKDAAASLKAKLNQTATRDEMVAIGYQLIDALPLPPMVIGAVNELRSFVTKLAEIGSTP